MYPQSTIIDAISPGVVSISLSLTSISARPLLIIFGWRVPDRIIDIYYKRSNKIPYDPGVNIKVNKDNGNELWFSSNPFRDKISLKLYTKEETQPAVKIYDLKGSVIKIHILK